MSFKGKCNAYGNNIYTSRQLYKSLQGEANVASEHAFTIVQLVARHIFETDIPLRDLPCPKSCLNFMDEANHIAKQQVVDKILSSNLFTHASDGTSREKKHFMEHHIELDHGATLSVGFSEVPNDKADTLLKKSVDLFDELSDTYCEGGDVEKNEVFLYILEKMKGLPSDRAANMKSFNQKMLQHKKDLVGNDACIEFINCNAHFVIALSDATEKGIKEIESSEFYGHQLGRDIDPTFSRFANCMESSACRLIRTISDVLGPRGDEKNGCREDWLVYCSMKEIRSLFTSYRSNRFNNLFENDAASLCHKTAALDFLQNKVGHSDQKLQSITLDLQDSLAYADAMCVRGVDDQLHTGG